MGVGNKAGGGRDTENQACKGTDNEATREWEDNSKLNPKNKGNIKETRLQLAIGGSEDGVREQSWR